MDSPDKALAPWWALYAVGAVAMAIFLVALVAACFLGNETLITSLFAIAGGGFTTVLGFFLGSSDGSRSKDKVIATLPPAPH